MSQKSITKSSEKDLENFWKQAVQDVKAKAKAVPCENDEEMKKCVLRMDQKDDFLKNRRENDQRNVEYFWRISVEQAKKSKEMVSDEQLKTSLMRVCG